MSKLSPSDTSAAARPADSVDPSDSAALHRSSQQPGTEQHGRRISRVMLLQRELNDKPVPVPRPSAPTATAVARASEALRARGVEPVGPDCTDHIDLVLVLGGDGTIRHVAGELAGSGVPLGILPTGTGNLLARNLGLPIGSGVRDLASIAITGRSRRIDVGWVEADGPSLEQTAAIARIAPDSHAFAGSTPFLVIAGMGFDAAVMHSAGRGLKRTMGWGAYVVSGLRYLRRRRVKAHIVAGEGHNEFDLEARAILFANCGRLPGGFVLAPDARIDDGWLDLVVVDTKIGLLGWGDLVRRVGLQSLGLRRRPQMLPEVGSIELRRMRSVHVQAGDPELVEADGDALGYAWNVRARIERGTLLVHVL